jgi:radical SAM superfamily enzyme YgiQ (UPF0313 family)
MEVILYNPQSNRSLKKKRFPTALGEICAGITGEFDFKIVDGNIEDHFLARIMSIIEESQEAKIVLGISVMPGFQTIQAIYTSKAVKAKHPEVIIVWGGFFASAYPEIIINSNYVDLVIIGQGEQTFLEVLQSIKESGDIDEGIEGICIKKNGRIIRTNNRKMHPMLTNEIPYEKFEMLKYLSKSGIGEHTLYYASSMGCRGSCNFCGIKAVYKGNPGWFGQDAAVFHKRLVKLKSMASFDSIQFVDADQFPEINWATEILNIVKDFNLNWRGYAKVEFLASQPASFWEWLKSTRCKCLFMGVESADANCVHKMSKRVNIEQTLDVANKCKEYGIIPEFSFIFCSPRDTMDTLDNTILLIREIKNKCPVSNVIIYFYSPPHINRELELEDWKSKDLYDQMVWNNPYSSNIDKQIISKALDFRQVLYTYSPKVTDFTNSNLKTWLVKKIAGFRYRNGFYANPVELAVLDKLLHISKVE